MSYPVCTLKEGRERSLYNKHPWVFSGAIDSMEPESEMAQIVDIHGANGRFIARGYYNPNSQIRIRVLTFKDEAINTDFFANRFRYANNWRQTVFRRPSDSYRVINAEGDGLPGLIIDRYGEFLVVQFLTTGIEIFRSEITDALVQTFNPKGIFEKSEGGFRKEEGLEAIASSLYGEEPPELLQISEQGLKYYVDIKNGQRTGFYLDQRKGRHMAKAHADGRTVLNCFGYTGAFTVACLAGGAKRVITVDTSQAALDLAKKNVELNGFEVRDEDFVVADAFVFLREYRGNTDFALLTPPAFAKSRASMQKGSRAYKDINFNAIRLLDDQGLLLTFSGSGHIGSEMFQKILFAATADAGKNLQILSKLSGGADHPINIYHPEGEYLTGVFGRVSD